MHNFIGIGKCNLYFAFRDFVLYPLISAINTKTELDALLTNFGGQNKLKS
jgi:hypothetical protein